MPGDVSGNGMLLSRHIKLVAAFDHRHVFLDPAPDVEASFRERERMFALPRSSWDDYDRKLISQGGGVYPRTAKAIAVSAEAAAVLGIEAGELAPPDLLQGILQAPAELFYNGGHRPYLNAGGPAHTGDRDRANDPGPDNHRHRPLQGVGQGRQ